MRRLETLVLMAGVGLPDAAVRSQLCSAVDLIAHLERDAAGRRRVVQVAELVPGADHRGAVRVVADEHRVLGAAPDRRTPAASAGPVTVGAWVAASGSGVLVALLGRVRPRSGPTGRSRPVAAPRSVDAGARPGRERWCGAGRGPAGRHR